MMKLLLVVLPVTAVLGSYALPLNTPIGQLFLFRLLILVGVLVLLLTNRKISWHHDALASFFVAFVLFWMFYGLLSMLWTPDPLSGLKDIEALFFGLLLITLLLTAPSPQDAKFIHLARGWLSVYVICAMFAIWEWTTGHHLISNFSLTHPAYALDHIVYGTLGNPNNFAATIVLAWPFVLTVSKKDKSTVVMALVRVAVILSAPVLILMAAGRLSLIAFIAQIVAWWLINIKRPKRALAIAFCAAAVVGVSAMWTMSDPYIVKKLMIIVNEGFAGHQSLTIRLNLILNGMHMLLQSFGIGVGAGGFEAVMSQGAPYWTRNIIDPHSFWNEVFSEYGILVGMGFVVLFVWMMIRSLRGRVGAVLVGNALAARANECVFLILVGYFFACSENSTYLTQSVNWMILAATLIFLTEAKPRLDAKKLAIRPARSIYGAPLELPSANTAAARPRNPAGGPG